MNETAFLDFQHIRCLHLEHTCTNAADVVRCRRTRVVRASKRRYVKIEEGGLIHFLLYRLRYKNNNDCVIYYLRTASTAEVPENACSAFANMICYRQSRNILLNRIGHGVFGYSLRFSHFYGDAILNYLLEFFFA